RAGLHARDDVPGAADADGSRAAPGLREGGPGRARRRHAVPQLLQPGGDAGPGPRGRVSGRAACLGRAARRALFRGPDGRLAPAEPGRGAAGREYLARGAWLARPAPRRHGAAMSDREAREQYEALPYPARDPRDEAKRLIVGSPSHVLEIDHYIYGGRRDWSRPFRALFAGGGTGDGAVMLAQQLADLGCPAEIVHLDQSAAAQKIAAARAERRGLVLRCVPGSL